MRAVVLLVAAAGCAEPAIEMSLKLPTADEAADFDVSCVTAVDVEAYTTDDEGPYDIGLRMDIIGKRAPCITLTEPPTSFADIAAAIRGKFTMPIPAEGLGAIQIRGRVGTCDDMPNYHEAVFYGGSAYSEGADAVTLKLMPNVSCAKTATIKSRPLDLLAITASIDHACTPVTTPGVAFPGIIRPAKLGTAYPPLIFEAGSDFGNLGMDGTATLQSFSASAAGTCVSMAYSGELGVGNTCVNTGAPQDVCGGGAGIVDIPVINPIALGAAIDPILYRDYGPPVLGVVWKPNPRGPVAGATVTSNGTRTAIRFVEPNNGNLQEIAGDVTGPSGMFLAYSPTLHSVTASAAGKQRSLYAGGGRELEGTMFFLLPP